MSGELVDFGTVMAPIPTCVTVVTTDGEAGRAGQTVSAVSVASYDPPMVLVAIQKRTSTGAGDLIAANAAFAVNYLGTQHDHVSDTFAGRPWPGKEKWDFTCGDWVDADGLPVLSDGLVTATCRLVAEFEAGTHRVFLGEVTDLDHHDGDPLIYANRTYGTHVETEPTRFPHMPEAKPRTRKKKAS